MKRSMRSQNRRTRGGNLLGSEEGDKRLVISLNCDGLAEDEIREFLASPGDCKCLLPYLGISLLSVRH